MYKVKNVSLNAYLTKYNCKKLDDLQDLKEDDLMNLCDELNVVPYYQFSKKTTAAAEAFESRVGPKTILNFHKTVERIIKENTVKFYMPTDYWTTTKREQARKRDLYSRMQDSQTGQDTLDLMKEIEVGVDLKPGEEVLVDFTDKYVEQELKKSAYMKKVEVSKETGEVIDRVIPVDEGKKPYDGVRVEDMDYATLKAMAIDYGIRYTGVAKSDLVKRLLEVKRT